MRGILILYLLSPLTALQTMVHIPGSCYYNIDDNTYYCDQIDTFPHISYNDKKRYALKCFNCRITTLDDSTFQPDDAFESMDFSSGRLQLITSEAFRNVKSVSYLNLADNHISNISANAFDGLRHIFELQLDRNELTELTPWMFNGFEGNTVSFSGNKVQSIPQNAFGGVHGIMVLNFSYNEINKLSSESFQHLDGLEILDLQYNKICLIPLGIFKDIKTLTVLNLAHNRLHLYNFVPGIFSGLPNLRNLNLSHNNLQRFDSNILLPMDVLSNLDISGNSLTHLDTSSLHANAPNIQYLSINENIWSCSKLEDMVRHFKSIKVDISSYTAGSYNVTNVYGIPCLNEQFSYDINYRQFLKKIDSSSTKYAYDCPREIIR